MRNGQYLMLCMVSLLMMWIWNDSAKKEFHRVSLVLLAFVWFPVTERLLAEYQTYFYSKSALWELLPVTQILGSGVVIAEYQMERVLTKEYGRWKEAVSNRKRIWVRIMIGTMLAGLLFLCGTLSPARCVTKASPSATGISKEAEEVLELLEFPKGKQIWLVAPDAIMRWARIYSGNILLPYGRNLYEPELNAYTYDTYDAYDISEHRQTELHSWINFIAPESSKEKHWLEVCSGKAWDYLVFTRERYEEESFQKALNSQKDYRFFAETDGYVVFRFY